MDLDPQLAAASHYPVGGLVQQSSTPSPSAQLQHQHHHRGSGGLDTDSPSSNPQPPYQDHPDEAKKPRACEACRGLKVRCEPDEEDDAAPCKRCRKAGRRCVVTVPSRKRQKKTDSRVSELEKKIDALTASLQSRAAGAAGSPEDEKSPVPTSMPSRQRTSMEEGHPGWGSAQQQERNGSMNVPPVPSPAPFPRRDTPVYQPMAGQKRKNSDRRPTIDEDRRASPIASPSPWLAKAHDGDIVDRGMITMEKACELFARYRDQMAVHLPAVVFQPSMSAGELRRTKPVLFLSVMTAAMSELPQVQRLLQAELMHTFADKIFISGDKNLEIIQAIIIAVIWYWPPEHFEELKFYQLVHAAAVMGIDIGLGKKSPGKRGPPVPVSWQNHPFRRNAPPDASSIESRRTWLGCFYLASNTSIALHRANLIRWSPFMAESLDILKASPDAAPTDELFCHLVWSHHIGEEIGVQFGMDEQTQIVNINEPRTQHSLKALERDLAKHREGVDEDLMGPTLKIGFHMINLYMHEIALHANSGADQLHPPFNTNAFKEGAVGSEPLSPAHINALSTCLTAIDGIFATFLAQDVPTLRAIPVFNFVRVAYAIVILLKMYFSASRPGSDLGKVIDKDNLRVECYLDALLDKFRATAADDRCRPAGKFIVVLGMLKSWFVKQVRQELADHSSSEGQSRRQSQPQSSLNQQHNQQHLQQHQQPPVNTPLQLLSEVATSNDHDPRQTHSSTSNHNNAMAPPDTSFYSQQQVMSAPPLGDPSPAWATNLPFPMDPALAAADYNSMPTVDFNDPATMNMIVAEPWFSDMIQGMPETGNIFNF